MNASDVLKTSFFFSESMASLTATTTTTSSAKDLILFSIPIRNLIQEGNYEEVKKYLDSGILDPNQDLSLDGFRIPVLQYAIRWQKEELAHLLITRGACLNQWHDDYGFGDQRSVLHFACAKALPSVVERLVELGADVNALTSKYKRTPLESAFVWCENTFAIETLILAGADASHVPDSFLENYQFHGVTNNWAAFEKARKLRDCF